MTFGERIVYYRKLAGFTQKSLADALEISPTRLNYWEKDKREPDIMMLNRLCAILKVDADTMLGRDENEIQREDELSDSEKEGIKKYRALDERGKEIVSAVLEIEYRHVTQKRVVSFAARGGGLQSTETNASDADIAAAFDELEDDISDNL